jgi:NAD(P)-dependent dehydrogenase (short-subunit alcohol dehydrogenase family)
MSKKAKKYSRREVIVGTGGLVAGGALYAGLMKADRAQAAPGGPVALMGQAYLSPLAQTPAKLDITPISPDYFVPDRFKGKTLLVTGGARGIGQATAIRAAREGANVAILDWLPNEGQATVDQIVEEGGNAIFIEGNVQNAEDCNRMVEETVKEFGELNLALNNAGVLDGVYSGDEFDFEAQRSLLPNMLHLATDEYFDAVLATNINGVFKSLRPELSQMLTQGKGGAIVNVGSIAGLIGLSGNPAYSASKHAVTGITRGAAIDYAPYGIRINSVNMAATDTPMIARAGQFVQAAQKEGAGSGMGSVKTQSLLAYADSKKRPATPWEQGAIILFLLSDDASNLTGCTYATDGGWTAF